MAKQTAVTEAVTAQVLRTFRDKYTKKLRGKGTEFSCDVKRVAEINFGQPKPLVVIVGAKPQKEAPTEQEVETTQAETPTEPEETATQAETATEPETETTQEPDAAAPEAKGKGKGKGAGKTDK